MFSSNARSASSALLALIVAAGSAACRTATYDGAQSASRTRLAPSDSRVLDVSLRTIGARALQSQPGRSLADVIQYFWPNVTTPPWRSQSPVLLREPEQLGVYANGASAGSLETLRSVPASQIARVRRLTPIEEQLEFGRQHAAGALVIDWAKTPR